MENLGRKLLCLPKNKDTKKHTTKKRVVEEYVENATAHGITKIYLSRQIFARLFWIAAFLTFFGFAVFQIIELSEKLTTYDYVTKIQVNVNQNGLKFPAVTICNSNAFLSSEVEKILGINTRNITNITSQEIMKIFQEQVVKFNESELKEMGQQPEVFFQAGTCLFNGKNCSYPTDFYMLTGPSVGNCFTFNENGSVSQPKLGVKHGLFLVVNIDQNNYNIHDPESIFTPAGVHITIHNPGQSTHFKSHSILAAPNQLTRLAVKRFEESRLKNPYRDNCTDDGVPGMKLLYPGGYSVQSCSATCYVLKMSQNCSAVDLESALLGSQQQHLNLTLATTKKEAECIQAFDKSFNNGYVYCDCPVLCQSTSFVTTVSTADWPSRKEMDLWRTKIGAEKFTSMNFTENYLALQIYYEDFSVLTTIHQPAYDSTQFFSDLGGQLGLWIGGSFFSLLEFGVMLAELIYIIVFPNNKNKKNEKEISQVKVKDSYSMSNPHT